jgi:hypothetical protein
MGNPVYLISTKKRTAGVTGQQRMLTPPRHLFICRGSVLSYIRFSNCLLDYDYELHIVNFAILYSRSYPLVGLLLLF